MTLRRVATPAVRRRRRGLTAVVATLVATLIPGAAGADAPAPSQWPATASAAPAIESWSNAIRFSGPNREQTALALALGLRGSGDYPFDTTDPSSGGAPTLAAADDWWGVDTCPRAIIVVAGDTPADSLAASALSDPTDNSSEPYLARTAAADPLFDPIGGFARVDTETAPIVVTRSARQGATALAAPARIAARDLRSGGCTLARQAIVVGGPAAVPAGVDAELVSLGYDEVFRVAGADRYDTAAAIARALGTGSFIDPGQACTDPAVNDGAARMGFYANAAIEARDSATTCRVLGRTVVLAEGITGADALAAGWWTSFWQVPVLLHDGSATLPPATVGALTTLPIDNVVILGGTARIPDDVVDDVEQLAGANAIRVSGVDRYATSAEMARRFGGWWPTGSADEYAGSMVCLAASSGSGNTGVGWPDALAAGPWCAAASSAAAGRGAPVRALSPLTGALPVATTPATRPAHDAVPVLLVRAGAETLPPSVDNLLRGAFDANDTFCSSVQALPGCVTPGFVIAVGGRTVLPSALVADTAQLAAGGAPASGAAAPPPLTAALLTSLDLAPVYAAAATTANQVCVPRDGYIESRWLSLLGPAPSRRVIAEADVMLDGRFVRDADGIVRSPGVGAPACVATSAPAPAQLRVRGAGLAGRIGAEQTFSTVAADRLAQTGAIADSGPDAASGTSTSDDSSNGGATTQTYVTSTPSSGLVSQGASAPITSASITFTLTRGTNLPSVTGVDRYSATITLATPNGTVTATSAGEAVFAGNVWHLRGKSTLTGGSWNAQTGTGGFSADLDAGPTPNAADDSISWQLDAVVSS